MYQLAHVANTVLYRAKSEGIAVTPMKLQKLIYFLYAECLYRYNRHLFAERFEAWRYGPVLDDVYQAFKENGASRIKGYMPDANGRYRVIDTESDFYFKRCFDAMWRAYAQKTGIELSKLTHNENGAWYIAVSNDATFLTDQAIIAEMGYRDNAKHAKEQSAHYD